MPYVGEIRMMANNYPPAGWAVCDGSLLSIYENETLFQLIGTTYGGDGNNTFGLPDLRGRVPMGIGGGETLGDAQGVESVALTGPQMPAHSHLMLSSTVQATSNNPQSNVPAAMAGGGDGAAYGIATPPAPTIQPASLTPAGGAQPHENRQPFLAINFVISLFGTMPSPT